MPMTEVFVEDRVAVAVAQPKAWRNWWRCIDKHVNPETGSIRFAGFNYSANSTHPSFETAEAAALHAMSGWLSKAGKAWEDYLFYLGPYPDGERP